MDKSLILNKIKEHLDIRFDRSFANFLGIKTTTLAMWHSRNTYDVELLFNKCEFLNPEYLITGEGEMLKQVKGHYPPDAANYKELAAARLEIIEGLKFKVATLEKELYVLKLTQGDPIVNEIVAKPAPELIAEKHK